MRRQCSNGTAERQSISARLVRNAGRYREAVIPPPETEVSLRAAGTSTTDRRTVTPMQGTCPRDAAGRYRAPPPTEMVVGTEHYFGYPTLRQDFRYHRNGSVGRVAAITQMCARKLRAPRVSGQTVLCNSFRESRPTERSPNARLCNLIRRAG